MKDWVATYEISDYLKEITLNNKKNGIFFVR